MAKEQLLVLPVACARAGVPYLIAWHAVVAGRVPAQRKGRCWFVRPSDLRALSAEPPSAGTS